MLRSDHRLGWLGVPGRLSGRNIWVSDEPLIRALESWSRLQIWDAAPVAGRLQQGRRARDGGLNEVLRLLEEEDFNAVVFGADVRDAWRTAAYERVAEVGGPIAIMVYTDSVEAMAMVKGP